MTTKCNCSCKDGAAMGLHDAECAIRGAVPALLQYDYASDFAEAFQLVFEGSNRPADNFETDTAWATWLYGQLRKAFPIMQRLRSKQSDPTDELGKVWDVLHAAGINSGGELSASEGVKLLADKVKALEPDCVHEWMWVESLSKMCCVNCPATRSKE